MILVDYPGLCELFLPQDPLSGAEHEAIPHAPPPLPAAQEQL